MRHRTRRVGLTGGIATGKSSLSRHLRLQGIPVIEADQVAREVLTLYPEILEYLKATYGDAVVEEGALNREALATIIFKDPEKRRAYEAVIMPRILQEIHRRMDLLSEAGVPLLVVDAPLLFEVGLDAAMDSIITVVTRRETQVARLMGRDGLTEEAARRRIAVQMPLEEKARRSHVVIDNDGTLEAAKEALDRAMEVWLKHEKEDAEETKG